MTLEQIDWLDRKGIHPDRVHIVGQTDTVVLAKDKKRNGVIKIKKDLRSCNF